MGIYDRDYYRNPGGGNAQLKSWASPAVGTIILLNIGCWFLQLMPKADSTVLHAMCSTGNSIFGGGFEIDVTCQAFDFGFSDPLNLKTKIQGFVIQYLYFC